MSQPQSNKKEYDVTMLALRSFDGSVFGSVNVLNIRGFSFNLNGNKFKKTICLF